jgi:hypothetical protein
MNIPEAMIRAVAQELGTQLRSDEWGPTHLAELARDALTAALSTCTIREEWGHSRKVAGAQWHSHQCPTADQYRLVIETAPERTTGE